VLLDERFGVKIGEYNERFGVFNEFVILLVLMYDAFLCKANEFP